MAMTVIDHGLLYDTHKAYDVLFFGESIYTTLTHDDDTVSQWISRVESLNLGRLHNLIVGLDVEWHPSFSLFRNRIATLQLCVGRHCLIYQIIHSGGIPCSLASFLSTILSWGSASKLIWKSFMMIIFAVAVVNTYGRSELRNSGIKELARLVLEKEVEELQRVTMSRWDNKLLTPDQVQYACVEAFVSFKMLVGS